MSTYEFAKYHKIGYIHPMHKITHKMWWTRRYKGKKTNAKLKLSGKS